MEEELKIIRTELKGKIGESVNLDEGENDFMRILQKFIFEYMTDKYR